VLVAALLNDRPEIALSAAALAGALLGFLRYNFGAATIFLGDCGSLFVGFALAGLAVRGSMKSSTAIAVAAPLLALALPIFDTALAALRRLLRGRSIFEADADHIHHRLLRRGLSPMAVVILLYGVAALFGALSLLSMTGHSQATGLVMIVFALTTWVGLRQLASPELASLNETVRRALAGGDRELGEAGRFRGRDARFAHVNDLAGLWPALIEECRRLGVCGLELRLDTGAGHAPSDEIQRFCWEAPTRAPEGEWSWSIPLTSAGGALGELSLRCPLPGLAPAQGAVLQAVAADVGRALERMRRAGARSKRVS
jgi:UDP-GlcNAc:undecaprenyl-phosphate GlcNAc-1-phosphate transferase